MLQKLNERIGIFDKLHILYVEDNETARESTLELLELFFKHVDTAIDGEDALEKYHLYHQQNNRYYDIVLTDINMPNMNGIELIKTLREIHSRQDIIVLSAHNEPEYLMEIINLEVTQFILKPIELSRFEAVFARVIEIIHQKRRFHQMHRELEEAKAKAEESAHQKSRFLANMSHEIRTPLNAIIGFISLLEEDETDEAKLKYLEVIRNSSDSLLQIINDILDISKIESGKLKIEPYNFDPYKDLIRIAELFQKKAAEKKINFRIKYNNNMPKLLYGDALRIKQIFTNLLSNAIKFTPEGKTVKSIIWYKDGRLHIVVKDYGIGISEEKQKHIFDAFTQADGSTAREYGGTGLGLSISLQLAHMLGGDLTLKSQEGRGSIFRLTVPMKEGKEEKREEEKIQKLHGHVLIVEDYEANRMFVSIILENAGLTYEMAEDGEEAVERFENGAFDLILMDENMPKMGGTEAARKIRDIEERIGKPHTPVISLTANALQGDRERFIAAGFDDYISKPIQPQSLLKSMARFLTVED